MFHLAQIVTLLLVPAIALFFLWFIYRLVKNLIDHYFERRAYWERYNSSRSKNDDGPPFRK